ncbi:MAG: O-antigen ligase family protein [Pyrinomonadaceae bacterium]|nr:O-antigen ligase family protein [Pyrinomonadaceae bacterium]
MRPLNNTAAQPLFMPSIKPARKIVREYQLPLTLLALHAPIGLLMAQSGTIAAAHAYITFLAGIYFAVSKSKKLEQVATVAAYLVASELLWRMANAPIFWEFGKYSAGCVLVTALVVRNKWKIPALPLAYFLFLIPSCIYIFVTRDYADARDRLSFNMSGPTLLFISCWFFSHVSVDKSQLKKMLLFLLLPLVSVAITTLFHTISVEEIRFSGESNYATSGGFGPNQVSAMLGLGVFLATVSFLMLKNRPFEKLILALMIIFLAAQSILTFSRSGMYNAGLAIITVILFQMKDSGKGFKHLILVGLLGLFFLVAIFPQMNEFTGGALQSRFQDIETTGRAEIAEADAMIFSNNPILGVGVGQAFIARAEYFNRVVASHTEFSRVIAEHGSFGILSIIAVLLMAGFAIKDKRTGFGKAFAAGFLAWGFAFMINTGMRLAAPSLMLGISLITIVEGQKKRKMLLSKAIKKPVEIKRTIDN